MTSHIGFLWQALGAMLGMVVLAASLDRRIRTRQPAPAWVSLGLLAHITRTVVFSLANYSRLTGLGLFPANFEAGNLSGIIYIALVAITVLAMFRALWSAAGRETPRRTFVIFLIVYGLDIVIASVVSLFWPAHSPRFARLQVDIFFDNPFGLAKAGLVLAILVLWIIKRKSLERRLSIGMACLLGSQLLDLVLRFYVPMASTLALPFLTYQLSFVAAAALIQSTARSIPTPRADCLPPPAAGTVASTAESTLAALRQSYSLSPEECAILEAVLAGASNKQIAWDRKLSLPVVKRRLFKLYRRMGIASRYELMALSSRLSAGALPPVRTEE